MEYPKFIEWIESLSAYIMGVLLKEVKINQDKINNSSRCFGLDHEQIKTSFNQFFIKGFNRYPDLVKMIIFFYYFLKMIISISPSTFCYLYASIVRKTEPSIALSIITVISERNPVLPFLICLYPDITNFNENIFSNRKVKPISDVFGAGLHLLILQDIFGPVIVRNVFGAFLLHTAIKNGTEMLQLNKIIRFLWTDINEGYQLNREQSEVESEINYDNDSEGGIPNKTAEQQLNKNRFHVSSISKILIHFINKYILELKWLHLLNLSFAINDMNWFSGKEFSANIFFKPRFLAKVKYENYQHNEPSEYQYLHYDAERFLNRLEKIIHSFIDNFEPLLKYGFGYQNNQILIEQLLIYIEVINIPLLAFIISIILQKSNKAVELLTNNTDILDDLWEILNLLTLKSVGEAASQFSWDRINWHEKTYCEKILLEIWKTIHNLKTSRSSLLLTEH